MTDNIQRAHARLGPSGYKRWSTCPGSVSLSKQFPDETSEYAAEGTAAHWVREQCLLTGKDVTDFVGDKVKADGYEFEVQPEWVNWLQPGIDRLREAPGKLYVEQRVSLEAWVEGEFGTVDGLVISDELIIVDDLKFGRGVAVNAERNGQLMIYALGAWENIARHLTDGTEFLLRIDQPRVPGGGSEWRCTLDELLLFAEHEYAPAARATLDPDAPLNPSIDACQFCKAATHFACPALHRFMADLLGFEFDDWRNLTLPDIDNLSPEQRSHIVKHSGMIRKWLGQAHEFHLNQALHGGDTPGYKAVATLGDRSWRDEDEAEEFWLGKMPAKDVFTKKLKSPVQMEKISGTRNWAKAQALITRPEGKPALVPEDDPRPALQALADMLEDLDDEFNDLLGVETDDLEDLI